MICIKCEKDLPEEEFAFRSKKLGTRNSRCKECQKLYCHAHYQRNKGKHNERRYENTKRYIARNRRFILRYLATHPCVDCGFSDQRALQFDHVRGKKSGNVSDMVRRGFALDTIKTEIRKCEVRCANCHAIKTVETFGYYNKLGVNS